MSREEGTVIIRQGRLSDLSAVSRIESLSFEDPWPDTALGGELLADDLRLPLVALVAGQVDGPTDEQPGVQPGEQLGGYLMSWKVADQLHVLNVAVDPGSLRCGIATALLREAARLAHDLGLLEMTLEVRRGNDPALAFYLRHGFIEVGVREGYYSQTGEDALIMNCPVESLIKP
ncbi:MAG: GNAT family N-acetyltransferase [Gemmatimonadales bacterium]|nr:GNAT family N-acetyltransferase [Gemmatimonadales bacterium]